MDDAKFPSCFTGMAVVAPPYLLVSPFPQFLPVFSTALKNIRILLEYVETNA